ncbi:MAG: transcriptional repressor [Proteobacteria bacterium]|nr:transcriptional repressor [Pseudomonadota bacterium]MBU1714860.1 transcriptional repressor [Pseudomonadota bacterium]
MNKLDKNEFRLTNQRKVILEELKKVKSHPTATEIYDMVRKKMPRISLGTVYRNLELLSNNSIIQKLDFGEAQKRFDGNPTTHYHINCKGCGRVDDVDMPLNQELDELAENATSYKVSSHHVEFSGFCVSCQN